MESYIVNSTPADILSICMSLKRIRNIGRANILYSKFQYFSERCLVSSMKVLTCFGYLTVTLTVLTELQSSSMFIALVRCVQYVQYKVA